MRMLPQQSAEWQQSRNVINILLKSRLKGKNHSRKQLYIYLQRGLFAWLFIRQMEERFKS